MRASLLILQDTKTRPASDPSSQSSLPTTHEDDDRYFDALIAGDLKRIDDVESEDFLVAASVRPRSPDGCARNCPHPARTPRLGLPVPHPPVAARTRALPDEGRDPSATIDSYLLDSGPPARAGSGADELVALGTLATSKKRMRVSSCSRVSAGPA